MRDYSKWFCLLFLVLGVVPMYYINTISKGNFLAGPMTIILLLLPSMVIQFILFVIVWGNHRAGNRNLILTSISLLITIFQFYTLYLYLTRIT